MFVGTPRLVQAARTGHPRTISCLGMMRENSDVVETLRFQYKLQRQATHVPYHVWE